MIRVVLAEDHYVVRRGIQTLIAAESGIHVVGEADDGLKAFSLVEELQPHVLITDVMMPGLNGLELTRRIRERFPRTGVLIFSMHADETYVVEALKAGATGYVLKDAKHLDVAQAIRAVAVGEMHLDPSLSEARVAERLACRLGPAIDSFDLLSPREREILHHVANGQSSRHIATQLSISSRTVEIHRRNIMRKLDLRGQIDLVRFAIRHGIIPLS